MLLSKIQKLISKSNLVNAYYHRLPEPLQTEMLYKKMKLIIFMYQQKFKNWFS